MEGLYEYFLLIAIVSLLLYGLVRQVKHTGIIKKMSEKTVKQYKKVLTASYLATVAYIGFTVSLVLNITYGMHIMNISESIGDKTALSSFVFLIILFVTKFGFMPKKKQQII